MQKELSKPSTEPTKDRPLLVPDPPPGVTPVVIAGLTLAARALIGPFGLELSSVARILEITGASRSRAYELKAEIEALLPPLARPPGRPRVEPAPVSEARLIELKDAVLGFMIDHPGCVQRGERATYSEPYRRFVIALREQHADVMRSVFAEAIQLPLGTLDDWMRVASLDGRAASDAIGPRDPDAAGDIANAVNTYKTSNAVDSSHEEAITETTNHVNQDIIENITCPVDDSSINDVVNQIRECNIDNGPNPLSGLSIGDIAHPFDTYENSEVAKQLDTCTAHRQVASPPERAAEHVANPPRMAAHDAKRAQIETVLAAWHAWQGTFRAFCKHVRRDHRLELGDTLIANILFEHGARTPARRGGRSRDEEALRGSFETFFPGAQWVGDGKQLGVVLDGKTFTMNLELVVDAASDAAVGISVRDEEDSAAVIEAFAQGVQTAGHAPLALLLDNRPSNHTPEVEAALDDTLRIRATKERPQNKAHVEGAFGLFAQKVPLIELDTRDAHAHAKAIAQLVATTFFRALNRAPRRDRDGKTRAELYAEPVTPEQREAARAALCERMRKQELARQTRAARKDPVVGALLDDAFARLGLLDPERHVRDAIACYPRDAIVDAIAIFDGKHTAGTLPNGVDARYLLGIVRNLHHVHQADPITEALIRERLAARDRFLEPLVRERDAILAMVDADVDVTLIALIDRLVRAERTVDRYVWLHAAADLVAPYEHDERVALAQCAARRIHAAFRLSTHDRDHLERSFLRLLWPLE